MQDIITLRGLSAFGTHGVYDFEQRDPQPFTVDVSLWVDTTVATRDDDLESTVSYAQVAADVVAEIEGPSVRLIETLADRIAAKLMAYPLVDGVEVTVHKPQAPLDVDFADVAVTTRRGHCATSPVETVEPAPYSTPSATSPVEPAPYSAPPATSPVEPAPYSAAPFVLAFGGNQGNVPVTLVRALETLMDLPELSITEISPLIRTEAVVKPGAPAQDDHWNMVVIGNTTLTPHELLDVTSGIEGSLGRERPYEWAPRTIDIDLISVGEHVIDDARLQLPHPRAHGRAFVLLPWLLADPDAELLGYGSVASLLAAAPDQSGVRDIIEDWYLHPETVMADSDAVLLAEPLASEHHLPESTDDPVVANVLPVELTEAPAAEVPLNVPTDASNLSGGRNFAAEWERFVKTVDFDAEPEDALAAEERESFEPFAEPSYVAPVDGKVSVENSEYQAPSFDQALEEEQKIEQAPHISWIPVGQATPVMTDDTGENAVISPSDAEPAQSVAQRPLPSWNFAQAPVTIIDSFDDEEPPADEPIQEIALEPDLPEGAEIGVVEDAVAEPVVLSRRSVLRPTHTGAVPVIKRS